MPSHFAVDLVAGGVAGSAAQTFWAPMERVKLLLQVQTASPQISKPYKGVVNCFVRIFNEQGVLSFWRGNLANVLRTFPMQGVLFATKDAIRECFVGSTTKAHPWKYFVANLLAGGAAGAAALTLIYPLDLARTRLGADVGVGKTRLYGGIRDCLSKVYKSGGVQGLYSGFGVSVAGVVVYRAVLLGGYDTAMDVCFDDARKAPVWHKWLMAQGVLTVARLVSYPFDTVRRRMMMQVGSKDVVYTSTWDCWHKIWTKEGHLKGFFKGAGVNIVRGTGTSLMLVLYDELKHMV